MTQLALARHPVAQTGADGAQLLTQRFLDATALAVELHGDQRRAGTDIPYMAHLLIVAGLVLEEGGDETDAIVALLHDAVEECGDPALERIHDQFGARIAAAVLECSDGGEPNDTVPWRERKQAHLRHMAAVDDDHLLLILLADKVHNARSMVRDLGDEGDALWHRFADRTVDDQLWYFGELVDLFSRRCAGPLVDDLRRTVAELRVLRARG